MPTVAAIAQHFDVSPRTVQHWIGAGCPVIRRGRRGNGGGALLDVDQVRAWRQAQQQRDSGGAGVVIELAAQLPHILADAVAQAAREATGPDKVRLHGLLAEAWHTSILHALAALREQYPDVAHLLRDPSVLPEPVFRLAQVNRHAGVDLGEAE